jgi:multiple sugar transport system permease protein
MPKLKKSLLYWLLLSPLVVVILFPFAVMFVTAVRPREELFVYRRRWTFSEFRWDNFVDMWEKTNFGGALLNSVYVSVASTLLALGAEHPGRLCAVALPLPGKGVYRKFLLMTQMMSPIVLVLGLFRLMVFSSGWSTTSTRWC